MKKGSDNQYTYCSVENCGVPLKTWEFGKCTSCKQKAESAQHQTPKQQPLPEKDTLREKIAKYAVDYDKSYANGVARLSNTKEEKEEKGVKKLNPEKTFKTLSGMTDEEFAEYEKYGMGGVS